MTEPASAGRGVGAGFGAGLVPAGLGRGAARGALSAGGGGDAWETAKRANVRLATQNATATKPGGTLFIATGLLAATVAPGRARRATTLRFACGHDALELEHERS